MSQVIFDATTTKAQALAGINANFTEVYTTVAGHAVSIASINAALAALGTMASQNADAVAITGGSITGVPGTLTVDSGWTAQPDDGDKGIILPAATVLSDLGMYINSVFTNTDTFSVGSILNGLIQEVKALRATLRDHLSPNN